MKLDCIFRITNRLKRIGNLSKIKLMRNKHLKSKIKKLLLCIKGLILNKEDVQKKFREYYLMKKIYYYLKLYNEKEIKKNENLIKNFIEYQLKLKALNLFIRHSNILKREEKILFKLKIFYLKNRKRKLRTIFSDWKRFYICEKFRKYKSFQKMVKFFYYLKFTLNKR